MHRWINIENWKICTVNNINTKIYTQKYIYPKIVSDHLVKAGIDIGI